MSIYCIADTHLSQASGKPMDIFGNRWQGYTDKLISSWNSLVTADDTIVLPGDISWGMTLEEAREDFILLDSLNGKKIIGKGNHDYWWQSVTKTENFFSENGIKSICLLHNNAYMFEDKIICGARGWFCDDRNAPENADFDKIIAREVIRAELSLNAGLKLREASGGDCEILMFLHFPPVYRDYVYRELVDLLHKFGVKRCYYGHLHGVYDIPRNFDFEGITMTVISADYLNFCPYRIF